jgi:hypothetical protein
MTRARWITFLAVIALVCTGGVAWSVVTPNVYTPPCTANTDACRQSRIVALETKVSQLDDRVTRLEATPAPTTAAPTTPPASPTPSATPTVAPTTSAPLIGWPDLTNTGVPAGTTLTPYTGPATITTAGTVITGKSITSCLVINAANVHISSSRISCVPGRDGTAVVENSTGLVLTDVEVDGGGHAGTSSTCGIAVGYDHFTLERVLVHGCSDGIRADGVVDMEDSYVDGLWASDPDHADGIQAYMGAGDMTFRHNRIDARTQDGCCENGAIFIADGYTGTVTVDNNYFAGGQFSMRYHENGTYIVTHNRVLDGSFAYGPTSTTYGIIQTWIDNKLIEADNSLGADILPDAS